MLDVHALSDALNEIIWHSSPWMRSCVFVRFGWFMNCLEFEMDRVFDASLSKACRLT